MAKAKVDEYKQEAISGLQDITFKLSFGAFMKYLDPVSIKQFEARNALIICYGIIVLIGSVFTLIMYRKARQ